jgi:hypothetical protein
MERSIIYDIYNSSGGHMNELKYFNKIDIRLTQQNMIMSKNCRRKY